MSKKEKKQFKPLPKLTAKILLNRKWTVWRQAETKTRELNVLNENKNLIMSVLAKGIKNELNSSNDYYADRFNYMMFNMNKRSSAAKPKNYCYYVGRSRSVNRKLFMARHTFRKFARYGMLPGFIKERC